MKTFYIIVCCLLLTSCNEREADIAFRTLHALAVTAVVTSDIAEEIKYQNQQAQMREIEGLDLSIYTRCQYEQFYQEREYGPPVLCTRNEDCTTKCDEWK